MTALVVRPDHLGDDLRELIERLYPICRSITGDGVRETLSIIGDHIPLRIHEVPSGTAVLDWVVPPEWNIRDAYIKNAEGDRVVDFRVSNLHAVSYSVPVHETMSLEALRPHLHTLPNQPGLVPYRTSYYSEDWGFCLTQHALDALPDGDYEVMVDSTLAPGSLTYGELLVPGLLDEEILVSTHVCHPSLCNDNLSGIAISTMLARELVGRTPRRTLRFVFAPGTIGAVTWLANNRDRSARIVAGLTLTCLGDEHPFTYKRTERGDALIDRTATYVLDRSVLDAGSIDFIPVRLRRTPVQLTRVSNSGRLADARTPRPVPRIPHLGRRSRLRVDVPNGGVVRCAERDPRCHRPEPDHAQHSTVRRTPTRQPRAVHRVGWNEDR